MQSWWPVKQKSQHPAFYKNINIVPNWTIIHGISLVMFTLRFSKCFLKWGTGKIKGDNAVDLKTFGKCPALCGERKRNILENIFYVLVLLPSSLFYSQHCRGLLDLFCALHKPLRTSEVSFHNVSARIWGTFSVWTAMHFYEFIRSFPVLGLPYSKGIYYLNIDEWTTR